MIVVVNVGVTVGDRVNVWVTTGKVNVGDKIFSIGSDGDKVAVICWSVFEFLLFQYMNKPKQ